MEGAYFNRLGQHSSRSPRKQRRMPRREIDDDDDDDDSASSPATEYRRPRRKPKRRSATLSPAGYRYDRLSVPSAPSTQSTRRRSDVSDMDLLAARLLKQSLNGPRSSMRSFSPLSSGAHKRPDLPSFATSGTGGSQKKRSRRGSMQQNLRKTSSEPCVEECDQEKMDRIRELLNSLTIPAYQTGVRKTHRHHSQSPASQEVWATPRGSLMAADIGRAANDSNSASESDMINTDIEELKEAAQSIQSLSRVFKLPASPQEAMTMTSPLGRISDQDQATLGRVVPSLSVSSPSANETAANGNGAFQHRRYGITTRLGGHPRGVMQFLPSVKQSAFLSQNALDTYTSSKNRREGVMQPSSSDARLTATTVQPRYSHSLSMPGYEPAPPNLLPTDYPVGVVQMRRKVSMPEAFYGFETSADELYVVPADIIGHQDHFSASYHADYPSSLEQEELMMHNTDRKASAPQERLRQVSRFASFGSQAAARQQQSRKPIVRQMSEHDKSSLSDMDLGTYQQGIKGAESLAGFSRFSKLLKSLRSSRQNSPDNLTDSMALSPASSESPLSSPGRSDRRIVLAKSESVPWGGRSTIRLSASGMDEHGVDDSMFQADLMLWRKRSRASLRRHEDTRTHIVKELYDTEANYVGNLKHMVQKYMRPLKQPIECTLIEPGLVDDIFFKIPEILGHHELFYAALHSRMDNWDSRQKIGDIILNNFTKQSVIDTYTTFINNWKYAKTAIAEARTKPAFAKYYDRCSREHKNKLTLEALLIMPVQRIPRYELLLKELLKHTSVEHPDHNLLIRAQKEIHELAIKINHVEQEASMCEQMQQRLREIEAIVDGLDDLVSVDRTFFCHDLVTVAGQNGKKERCLFLMSDQIIVTSVKRKSTGALRKAGSFAAAPNTDFLDNNKFKLLMKISLEDVEIGRNTLPLLNRAQNELSSAQEDLKILNKITDLAKLLSVDNTSLKGTVCDMQAAMRTCLLEKQDEMANDPVLTSLDLLVTTEEGIETFTVRFHNAEKRAAWEATFNNAKTTLRTSLARKPPPDFIKSVVMQKTRAGLQFSCATPTLARNDNGYQNVWVCNSDGYIGQLCVVNVRPEPELESCNGVANSKIRAICPVPVAKMLWIDFLLIDCRGSLQRRSKRLSVTSRTFSGEQPTALNHTNGTLTTDKKSRPSNLELESDSSDNEDATDGRTSGASKSSSSVVVDDKVLMEPGAQAGSQSAANDEDEHVSTVWLGTDDGEILVFNFLDNVRTKRASLKTKLPSAITALVYIDDRVFASLGNKELVFFERFPEAGWVWDLEHPRTVHLDSALLAPISAMLLVTNRLWFASRNQVFVLNANTLLKERVFQVNSDSCSSVECMSTIGSCVFLAIQGSPVIKLFHVFNCECLLEMNISPIVTKTLAGCDDIIRQHKLACLRVTALLCCKEQLWVGTSAGAIVHVAIPHVPPNVSRLTTTPNMTVCQVGHCGQCRFLTSVDLSPAALSRVNSFGSSGLGDSSRRRMSLNVAALQQGKVYVISGGDGFEDFHDMTTDEGDDSIGREDSANYLLFWHV